jgi:hypothetical protein
MESIRNLLRESPMKFKDLHLAIAQRYPEQCPTRGTKVSLAAMAWLSEIQRDLQQIAVNLQGVWHLKEQIPPRVPLQSIESTLEPDQQASLRTGEKAPIKKAERPKPRQRFPYGEVAKMWEEGETIATIAHAILLLGSFC